MRENSQAAGKTWTYAYDDGGKRITKTVNGTAYNYHYLGDQLVELTWSGNKLHFTYDSTGPLSVNCNGAEYFYVKNAQGDVTGLVSASGTRVVTYTYDAWGNPLSTSGTMASTLGSANPLRYRGYVYDTETGLYYLQSRYYNPEWGRFINADSVIDNRGVHTQNFFIYCGNNPVALTDDDGNFFHLAVGAIIGGVLSGASKIITNKIEGKPLTSGLGRAIFFGAIGGALAATGAGLVAMAIGGAVVSAVENAVDQVVRNKGFRNYNIWETTYEATSGAVFALAGGPGQGSKHLNQLGAQVVKRTAKEISEGGLQAGIKEAGRAMKYYLKNTKSYYHEVIQGIPKNAGLTAAKGIMSMDTVKNSVMMYFRW